MCAKRLEQKLDALCAVSQSTYSTKHTKGNQSDENQSSTSQVSANAMCEQPSDELCKQKENVSLESDDPSEPNLNKPVLLQTALNKIPLASAIAKLSNCDPEMPWRIAVSQKGSLCCPWCSCVCHRPGRSHSPEKLNSIMGRLFVGYFGLPKLAAPCNEIACRSRSPSSVQLHYYFPSWFLRAVISMIFIYTPRDGPRCALRLSWICPNSSTIFWFAIRDDVRGMRRWLAEGRASPFDASDDVGWTALYVRYKKHAADARLTKRKVCCHERRGKRLPLIGTRGG